MPLVIDANQESVQDKNRRRDKFEYVTLTPHQRDYVMYRKMESLNSEVCDTYHTPDKPWVEQTVGVPDILRRRGLTNRVMVNSGELGTNELSEDHGYIFTYHGSCLGERGVNSEGNFITREEAEDLAALTNADPLPIYSVWEFRLHELVLTDGPERTARLLETEADKQSDAQTKLIDTVSEAFSRLGKGNSDIDTVVGGAPHDVQAQLAAMSEDERIAMFQQAQLKAEDDGQTISTMELPEDA